MDKDDKLIELKENKEYIPDEVKNNPVTKAIEEEQKEEARLQMEYQKKQKYYIKTKKLLRYILERSIYIFNFIPFPFMFAEILLRVMLDLSTRGVLIAGIIFYFLLLICLILAPIEPESEQGKGSIGFALLFGTVEIGLVIADIVNFHKSSESMIGMMKTFIKVKAICQYTAFGFDLLLMIFGYFIDKALD